MHLVPALHRPVEVLQGTLVAEVVGSQCSLPPHVGLAVVTQDGAAVSELNFMFNSVDDTYRRASLTSTSGIATAPERPHRSEKQEQVQRYR